MSIDLDDPEVKAAIKAGVKAGIADEVGGLKAKNTELLSKLQEARKGQEIDPADYAKLESRITELEGEVATANKAAKTAQAEADKSNKALEGERSASTKLAIDSGLSAEIAKANVAPHFVDAVKAMIGQKTSLSDDRTVMVGEKSLTDFMSEWSQGDEGKHYIVAPNNSGGGAGGSGGGGGEKTMSRSDFDGKGAGERMAFVKDGGTVTD